MKASKNFEDVELLYKINNNIVQRNLSEPYQRILVAVSGGQDSIWIMKIMYHLKTKWQWKLGIIHCDHRWNNFSQVQAKHVQHLAVNMHIDYYQPVAIKFIKKETFARNWRYQMIQTIALKYNYTAIVTAHNASDRIETLIYNLIRGTGLQGMQALSWKKQINHIRYTPCINWLTHILISWQKLQYYKIDQIIFLAENLPFLQIIRPLLDITRTELRVLLKFWKMPSWPDLTNHKLGIHRNRIRHRLLPYIRLHYNPRIDQALARWTEILYAENIYLDRLTNYILCKIQINITIYMLNIYPGGLNIDLLRSLPIALQRRVLKKFLFKVTKINLKFRYVEHIRLFCLLSKASAQYLNNNTYTHIMLEHPCLYLPSQGKLFVLNHLLIYAY
jgi:tRNA(Ile)-lysidine synthase